MKTRTYLLYPFLIFAAAFVLDKLPFVLGLQDYFVNTFSYINYDHKVDLKAELREYLSRPERKKVAVMFGNSRTMSFNNQYIDDRHPDWLLYNFSVPGGTPDFFLRYMEEFQADGIHPDYVVFAVTPQAMNAAAATQMDEVMLNGLSPSFVARHADRFSLDDIGNFAAKKMFWTYQYRVSLRGIFRRLRDDRKLAKQFRQFADWTRANLAKERGSVFFTVGGEPPKDYDGIVKQSEDIWRGFYKPFDLSEDQLYFTERSLAIAREMNVPAALLWARVSPTLRERIAAPLPADQIIGADRDGLSVRDVWLPEIVKLSEQYDAPLLDMNYGDGFQCDRYYDASHLAGDCFGAFADYLFGNLRGRSE